MAVAGISTLGITLSWCMESTAGVRPTSGYKLLTRINSLGEVNPDQEVIDASALEDDSTKEIPGRASSPGSLSVVVNRTNDTIDEWEDVIEAYWGRSNKNLGMWFQEINPNMDKADFIKAAPPTKIPIPGREQNGLETVTFNLTVEDWELGAKVAPSGGSGLGG